MGELKDIDGLPGVFIPAAWTSLLSESLLTIFTEHLNSCAVFLKKKAIDFEQQKDRLEVDKETKKDNEDEDEEEEEQDRGAERREKRKQKQQQQDNEDKEKLASMGNIEIECRFGKVNAERLNFSPGIDQDVFQSMRNHLLHKISLSQKGERPWFQEVTPQMPGIPGEDQQAQGVHCVETDYLDVLFEDNIRLTFRLYFSDKNLTVLKSLKLIEVIRKHKIGDDRTFVVSNQEKKQCFDMRISASSEQSFQGQVLKPTSTNLKRQKSSGSVISNVSARSQQAEYGYSDEVKDHVDYAKEVITKSYATSPTTRVFGGCPVEVIEKTITSDITLINMDANELLSRKKLAENDAFYSYAEQHGSNLSVNYVRQLTWSLLTPNELPALRGHENSKLRNFDLASSPTLKSTPVYLTNQPGRVMLRDESVWVCAASQYIICVTFGLLRPVQGKFAQSVGMPSSSSRTEAQQGLKIIHFRKKKRTAFSIRPNISLDLTRIQQSQNPATLSAEASSYELEMEALLDVTRLLRGSQAGHGLFTPLSVSSFRAVLLTVNMIKDVAKYVYGVRLEPPEKLLLSEEIWANAANIDNQRQALFKEALASLPQLTQTSPSNSLSGSQQKQRKRRISEDLEMLTSLPVATNKRSRRASLAKSTGSGVEETDQTIAANFYNQLDRSRDQRSESWIYHMRCFNNFAKTILIQEFMKRCVFQAKARDTHLDRLTELRILDLACGKGADLNKFVNATRDIHKARIVDYLGIDIAAQSLKDFVSRINSSKRRYDFPLTLVEADLGEKYVNSAGPEDLSQDGKAQKLSSWKRSTRKWEQTEPAELFATVVNEEQVDFVSMQFALHYLFETEQKADEFFCFVSGKLRPGGIFVATTVDCNRMIKHLLSTGPGEDTFYIRDERKQSICEVSFDDTVRNRLLTKPTSRRLSTIESNGNFGLKYRFKLKDSNVAAVDAPEWLIPVPDLYILARKHGLKLILYKSLPKYVSDMLYRNADDEAARKYTRLMRNMNVLNTSGKYSDVEFELSSLYVAVAFEKVDQNVGFNAMQIMKEMKEGIPDFDTLSSSYRAKLINTVKQNMNKGAEITVN